MRFDNQDNEQIDKLSKRDKTAVKKGGNKEKIKQERRRKRTNRNSH